MKIKVKITFKGDEREVKEIEADDFPFFDNGFLWVSIDWSKRKKLIIDLEGIEEIEYEIKDNNVKH